MRDREDPDTIAYLEAENTYADALTAHLEPLRTKIYDEMISHIKETDVSAPSKRGEYYYYSRTEQGLQYPITCRKRGSLEAEEEVLLDPNVLAKDLEYFALGNAAVSPDHSLLAYSTDTAGDETYTIHVKNLTTGELLPEEIPNTYYGLEWAADNRMFFYTVLNEQKRPYQLWRHQLGEAADVLIFEEKDERFEMTVDRTSSRAFIVLDISSQTTTEQRVLDFNNPLGEFRMLLPRRQDIEFSSTHHGDWFYLTINDTARNFRLVRTSVSTPGELEELIAPRDGITLEDAMAFQGHLVVTERANGLIRLIVGNFASGEKHAVTFPESVYMADAVTPWEFESTVLRYTYESLVTPASVIDYDMNARTSVVVKQQEVPGYDASLYETGRVWATAPDGVKVPISWVAKKGLARDGEAPAFLYGYGSYGISSDPTFSSTRLSLLERGFVYAIAHIRGGGDLGKPWHEAAKMLTKRLTFTDFVACAEHLIAEKFTSADRLAIRGGSAGGMLMGAVVNLRPDLFRAVLALVPFVDCLNTMLDPTLPLTVGEYEEWGNPQDEPYYHYIKSYAPYENVKAQPQYPWMLLRGGLNDPRVSYWEPAKWTARMRTVRTDASPLLLKTDMGAGHGGASGRYDKLRELAFDYAFVVDAVQSR
jgi:oligopeptidase B